MTAKKEINDIIAEIEGLTLKGAKRLVIDMHSRLVKSTPVDTGWAANNWIPSVRVPVVKTDGTPENVSSAASDEGAASVLLWKFFQGPAYITNNVPYINRLNQGSSKQAPAGFIERDILAAVDKANKEKTLK
jgi:hypothetical protein